MQTNTAGSSESSQLQTLSREVFWQRHVTQWHESGLTKMAYCQQFSLVYHQMVYWCTKAAKTAKTAKTANVNKDENHAPNNFVAVTVASPIGEPAGLLLRLPNGIVIEGIDEQSVSLVGKLVEQL